MLLLVYLDCHTNNKEFAMTVIMHMLNIFNFIYMY